MEGLCYTKDMEIIPAILTDNPEELVRLAHIFERAGVTRVHLDICDGKFVPTRTITGHEELHRFTSSLRWDVHLMVQEPDKRVDQWHQCDCVDRFIVHVEATHDMAMLAEHAHGHGQELWAAINPDTSLEKLHEAQGIDGICVMGVTPGAQGQPFQALTVDRIRQLSTDNGKLPLMVDGGITLITAPQCVAAGASLLVSGSFIVKSPDPAKAIAELQNVITR